jgi:hypothetical protein
MGHHQSGYADCRRSNYEDDQSHPAVEDGSLSGAAIQLVHEAS